MSSQHALFDPSRWQQLAGRRVIYDSVPAWSDEKARRLGNPPVVLCDWDDETETKYLKTDTRLPSDRPGSMVFPDGTTVVLTGGETRMFEIRDKDVALIERAANLHLDMIRESSNFYKRNHKS